MADKLDEIMAWKRTEVAPLIASLPSTERDLAALHAALPSPPSFAQALAKPGGKLALIAEIKRRSPSAGAIAPSASAPEQARRYQAAGADALSVLTDHKYFGGSLSDLSEVTAALSAQPPRLPCLRKDFFVHPAQVRQAREAGASAILIIMRALTDEEIRVLHGAARAAGLDALFEIHSETDLERAVRAGARLIGVNNRDLAVFRTDLALSERLIPLIPSSCLAISESGIFGAADARRVALAGARAVLVGEAFMKAADPAALAADLRDAALPHRHSGAA